VADEDRGLDVQVPSKSAARGSSVAVRIQLPKFTAGSKLRYRVTDDAGSSTIQEKDFNLIPDTKQVEWYVDVPPAYRRKSLKVAVDLESDTTRISKTIDVDVTD